jgi:hypothetical protein
MKQTLSYEIYLRAARASVRQVALLALVAAASVHAGERAQPPAQPAPDYNAFYQLGPDSLPHDGVAKGEVRGAFVLPSEAYPGTQHPTTSARC